MLPFTAHVYILHGDIVDGGSIPYVEDFCKSVYIQDYDTPPAFLTLLDQSTGSSNSRMEKLQHRLLHGHRTSKDSDFIAAITPTTSSLARYHSAASPEASAALLAAPKIQQMTFPKQAYRVFLRRRFGVAIPQIPLHRCSCKPKPELVCICSKGKERFVTHDSMALCIRDMAKCGRRVCQVRESGPVPRGRHREWNETRSSLRGLYISRSDRSLAMS